MIVMENKLVVEPDTRSASLPTQLFLYWLLGALIYKVTFHYYSSIQDIQSYHTKFECDLRNVVSYQREKSYKGGLNYLSFHSLSRVMI